MKKILLFILALAITSINASSTAYENAGVEQALFLHEQLNLAPVPDLLLRPGIPEYVPNEYEPVLSIVDMPDIPAASPCQGVSEISTVSEINALSETKAVSEINTFSETKAVSEINTFSEAKAVLEINTITISFAGDCTIGTDESFSGNTFNVVYEKTGDPSYFFSGVKSVFSEDDFTFVNLEGALTSATKKAEKKYRYKGDPSYVKILIEGSVEGVTLANNHTLDYFEAGFEETVNVLNDAGILYTYFETCFVKEIKGMKIGFLGYKGWGHEKKANMLLVEQVKQMREQGVNFIVANYHWGDQKVYVPNEAQRRMAHFAIDNGADLVIGHHPHVLQGLEVYKGKNIVYSLGNFCYGGSINPADKDTIIYQQILTFDTSRNEIINSDYRIIPALISSETKRNNYQPIIATGSEGERILEKIEALSKSLSE